MLMVHYCGHNYEINRTEEQCNRTQLKAVKKLRTAAIKRGLQLGRVFCFFESLDTNINFTRLLCMPNVVIEW